MSFSGILGQDRALKRLRRLLAGRNLPPALLFHGPAGVGKTLAALELAKALNCGSQGPDGACDSCPSCLSAGSGADPDLKRLNAAYQAGLSGEPVEKQQSVRVETVRHLLRDLELRSMLGRWKTAVIEEAHRLVPAAANALLKSLEEPPPRTLWILIAPRKEALLPTITSRCFAVAFGPLPGALACSILESRGASREEARRLSLAAEGSPGRALELKDRTLQDPASWLQDPLAPFRLAEGLDRELHLSRPAAEDLLQLMAWHLRSRSGETLKDPRRRGSLARLLALRRDLKANADPRLVVQLAALELQEAA